MPFLRRADRNCQRILDKLERWFLRRYDIRHSSAIIHHAAGLGRGRRTAGSHADLAHAEHPRGCARPPSLAPFVVGSVAYRRAPLCSTCSARPRSWSSTCSAIWFLLYRFCWKRDLSFFHASVPRIGAGIIVGYLPVFLIDEVWDLASQSDVRARRR